MGSAILKEAERLLKDPKRLEEVSAIQDPFHPLSKAVGLALEKMVKKLQRPRPSKTLLEEVKKYWIPMANHFGMWQMRYSLEDRHFALTDKKDHDLIYSLLKKNDKFHQNLFRDITTIISAYLKEIGFENFEIIFRKKNIYGIYEKIQRKQKNFNHIADVFAIRLIVPTLPDCYRALETLHYLWPPYREKFADYIAHPKPNGYQSLHTTLHCLKGQTVEFQIRTHDMDEVAKFGPASHAAYKRGLLTTAK